MVLFIFKSFIPTPWIFACAGFSAVSDLENIDGSALEGLFRVFCTSNLLAFHRLNSSGVSALVAGFFVIYTDVFGGSSEVV